MSVAMAIKGDNFSIIANDNRGTKYIPGEDGPYNDNLEKCYLSQFGWVGGIGGNSKDTETFMKNLKTYSVKTRKDIFTAYYMACEEVENLIGCYAELGIPLYIYSLNYPENGKIQMFIESVDLEKGYRKLTDKNTLVILPPKNTKRINRLIAEYTEKAKNYQSLCGSIYNIACFMKELAKINKAVNDFCSFGISLKLSDTELVYMKIRQKARDIINLYKKTGELSEYIEVVDELAL